MLEKTNLSYIEWILLFTAFAAGSVDVISFATLGGVFASAMTGNFALLAYYVAQGDAQSAMGSIVALSGFVMGCLLGGEAALLLFFGLYAIAMPHAISSPSDHLQILLLAVAMGIQAVAGQTISPTTIVFTTTLTNLVSTVVDSIANGGVFGLKDVKIQSSVVVSYLFGALLSGALIVHKIGGVVVLPFLAVTTAFLIHRKSAQTQT